MANPEHLKILRQGVDAWNDWQRMYPPVWPDLRGANLRGADLQSADLQGANLKDRKVGIDIARALYRTKMELKVANMMLATTSYFSRGVQAFKASRYDLELKDYEGILEWLNEYRPNPGGRLYIRGKQSCVTGG